MKENNNKILTKDLVVVKKHSNIKFVYLAIILLGTFFVCLSCFHSNLWFDESYSIAIANHSFKDIWTIGSNDVHPILYYFMLKIVKFVTNNNILACRLFSCIPLIIMAILGYTHIRKDFNEKTGLIFSFLSLFMPVCVIYAGEIRMYTWAMLFVTMMTIYAYRIYRSGISTKNWIIFSIFSLCSAYTHYYGLIVAFVENILLFSYFGIHTFKQRNNEVKYIKYTQNFRKSIVSALTQIIIYLPWAGALLLQASSVSKGFWITQPNYLEMLEFIFTGNLIKVEHLYKFIAWPVTVILLIYIIYMFIKNWKESKTAKIALSVYISAVVLIRIISLIQPILYARYLLNWEGILFFIMAFLMSKDDNKRVITACAIIFVSSIFIIINLMNVNYDKSNKEPIKYISENIQQEDILLIDNEGSGFVIDAELNMPASNVYFWDRKNWNVEKAYKAYGKTVYNIEDLKDYEGRIWAVSSNSFEFAQDIQNTFEDSKILEQKYFKIKYENYEFSISLIEKNSSINN